MIGDLFLSFALLGAEWVLWLLVLLSVASVAVMAERWRFHAARRVDLEALGKAVRGAFDDDEPSELGDKFGDNLSLAARVALAGAEVAKHGADACGEAMNSAKARGRQQYEERLPLLGTLGNNAPFIGLFGTVLGIVGAFNKLKEDPEGGIDVVGGDLSEALVATAIGILVAVPAVVAYNYFTRRNRDALAKADEIAHLTLAQLHRRDGTD